MSNKLVSPDNLASKAFAITLIGAVVYFLTVYVFVLNGDLSDAPPPSDRVGDFHD